MDTSPTSLFDAYEQDFKQLVQSIEERLGGLNDGIKGEERNSVIRRVSQMDIELQSIPQNVRSKYHIRLQEARNSLLKRKKGLAEAKASAARSDLLASKPGSYPSSDDPYASSSDRSRLLSGISMLENGSKRLEESQRLALETENQGAEILTNLRQQREQIENSRDTLYRADAAIDRASTTLKAMVRRMYQQKAITFAIIGVLILLIVIITWEKLS
ncbi:t-SNARE VTI1 [Coprinopsis cinerea okayama7|uniref:t-SNARE VTI1 n=1 Tax=Coprinopsis cinerea (strain Okayama-7 / 130 / ATCC MYA-4618 / FGSC 9003) TaxID=240176 RepID=A8NX54_COPC7|nr:t-SNARE VTI1 [Coprinopsis cinerea okayama7\|eukprot:XP_001837071.2 t-SNARE VTI1 [Coprinopsis cinerea okayama7\